MLSIIVFVHEAGHFATARMFGVRVQEFMIGLPGPSIGFTLKGTRFGVSPFLLGGYAKVAGMEGGKENPNLARALAYISEMGTVELAQVQEDEKQLGFPLEEALDILDIWGSIRRTRVRGGAYRYEIGELGSPSLGRPRTLLNPQAALDEERKHTYRALPWFKRVIVLIGGVVFNLVFAILVFTAVLMVLGTQVPTTTFESVVEGAPAAEAGLVAGDRILEVEGAEVASWDDFVAMVRTHDAGETIEVTVERDEVQLVYGVTLAAAEDGHPMMGVTTQAVRQPISLWDALGTSFGFIGMVAQFIVMLFNPATFNEVIGQSSSVVGISVEAKNAALSGFLPFIVLAAALSISIGLMNLLPIPPLDGGKIVVETIERITKRTIPVRVINGISIVGVGLFIMLFLFATQQDIQRYFLGG